MIKEKKLLVTSDDYGRDLTGVQNLRKKHKRFESELGSHEPAIKAVQEAGGQLIASSTLGGAEIEQRLQQLAEVWAAEDYPVSRCVEPSRVNCLV